MVDLDIKYLNECDNYILQLSNFLDKVYEVTFKNENVEVTKTYIGEFGGRLEELVKFIQNNKFLNARIFSNEIDLKFALESFGEAFHSGNYELCSEILKYEIKYILYKWQQKIKNV